MKLELKKQNDDGSIFYRYREEDCVFWFSQYNNGHIYRVNINGGDSIEYYAIEDDTYYPKHFYFIVPSVKISSIKEYDEFNKQIQKAEWIRFMLESFFARSEHGRLYFEKHNKENKQ